MVVLAAGGPSGQHHQGLRWRIVVVLLLVSLIPLCTVAFGSWAAFGRLMKAERLDRQHTAVQRHATAIERYLSERLQALDMVAHIYSTEQLTSQTVLEKVFDTLCGSYPGAFIDLGIIDGQGQHLAYVGPYDLEHKNYAETPWFAIVREEGAFVSDVFLGFRNAPHCVIAVKRQDGEQNLSILRATINSDTFYSLVHSREFGHSGDVFIVNQDGVYQTPPKHGRVLDRAPIQDLVVHEGVRDHLVTVAGRQMIQAATWLNANRWMLIVQQAEDEIMAPLRQALAWGTAVVSIALAMIVVTTILSTQHLSTQIDRANQEREALSRDLMRSAKLASVGELAAGLAHEINNPLAIIAVLQTNLADAIDDLGLDAKERELLFDYVLRCKQQVQRCKSITMKILQFGRERDSTLRPTDILPLLEEITNLLRRQARGQNVELQLDAEPGLPPLVVDGTELEQILANLVNNSMSALDGSGAITISARRVGAEVQLAVRDDGRGISPEDLQRIFLPFFTTKAVGQGTGLGLSVCHGIVHGWGGSIAAQSEVGKGTTITIHLPVPEETRHAEPSSQLTLT